MKFLGITEFYGGQSRVRFSYGYSNQGFHFSGQQPTHQQMIALEMPGLTSHDDGAIVAWLTERSPTTGGAGGRREIVEIPETLWRPAVLDDMLDAVNYGWVIWQSAAHFSLEAFDAFAARWFPELQRRTRALLGMPGDAAKVRALEGEQEFVRRVTAVFQQFPNRLYNDMTALMEALDRAQVEQLRQGGYDQARWLDGAERLLTSQMTIRLLEEVADALIRAGAAPEEYRALVEQVRSRPVLKERTTYGHGFWHRLTPHLRLEPNLFGEQIDISQANEQTVALNWELLEGLRVGSIVPGRAALVLREPSGRVIYIAGQRRLKFEVQRAGGRLERMENTLLVTDQGAGAVQKALLEVDLLDTLSNVDPAQAVARAAALDLPSNHPVYRAAAAAQDDPRQRRILADLLIELLVGIDADVARSLARGQARANRR